MRNSPAVALALSLALAAPGLAKAPPGAETPQALVERMRAAATSEDFGEMVSCLTPEARTKMSAALFAGAAMVVAFSQMGAELGESMAGDDATADAEAAKKAAEARAAAAAVQARFETLLGKYDLATADGQAVELEGEELGRRFAGLDHGAFVTEVMALMSSLPGEHSGSSEMDAPFPVGALEDLVVEGDRASGRIGDEPVRFVRIDGRWYAEPEEETELPADGGP